MINLRHDGIAPVAKFFVGKTGVEINNRERGVGEKFVGPVRAHGGAKLPRLGGGVGDAGAAAFPFRFGIENKSVGTLIKTEIGNRHFTGNVCAEGTVIAEDGHTVGLGGVDEIGGELGIAAGRAGEMFIARAGLDDAITDARRAVVLHEAVQIRDAGDVATEFVGGVLHKINPNAFAEIFGVNAAIANLRVTANAEGHQSQDGRQNFPVASCVHRAG